MHPEPLDCKASIAHALASLTAAAPVEHAGLAMTPLMGDDVPACDYLTLDAALEQRLADVTEVSDGGSVPELRVINRGSRPVLIVDGEELVGAKQNRVINLTVLIPIGEDTAIPVSCVEAHRWHYTSRSFTASPRAQYASGRASRMAQVSASLRRGDTPRADQGAVWDDIAAMSARLDSRSDTGAMSEIFETHASRVEEYVSRLAAREGQRGAIFTVHGRPVGLEVFDRSNTFRGMLPKLVRSYAIDAIDHSGRIPAGGSPGEFLDDVGAAEAVAVPAPGEGVHVRLQVKVNGAALLAGGRIVHLAAFVAGTARTRSAMHPEG